MKPLPPRMIPCLLLQSGGFYKTVRFDNPIYLGDPFNILRIFNEKEVDEICILDIGASRSGRPIDFVYLQEMASETFMPMSYGGGIRSLRDMELVFKSGFEKVVINTTFLERPDVVASASRFFGSQSIVVSINVRRTFFGQAKVYDWVHMRNHDVPLIDLVRKAEDSGAGEILLNSVDRDGTQSGYDLEAISLVCSSVNVPVIACGGAGSIHDFKHALDNGASAVAAGAFFVFFGPRRAVLVNVPAPAELERIVDMS